jgi:Flp pilus assembly protein TadD
MTIRLEDLKRSAKQGGTVTLAALRHPPSPRVLEAMAHAVKLMEKNRIGEAIEHLEKARGMDPEFPGIYRALGLVYLHQKQTEQAVPQFEKAVQLDPQDAKSLADLGVIYFQCSRWKDAEDAARRSLAADHAQKKARLVLGMSLVRQHHTTDEAFKALREAQSEFPDARLGIAQCFIIRNDVNSARTELQAYVDTDSATQKELAGRWLTQLKGATVAAAR